MKESLDACGNSRKLAAEYLGLKDAHFRKLIRENHIHIPTNSLKRYNNTDNTVSSQTSFCFRNRISGYLLKSGLITDHG